MEELKKYITNIPDFPAKGIIFRDVTSLLQSGEGFSAAVDEMLKQLEAESIFGRHLWKPMNLQPVFADAPFVSVDDEPVCDDLFKRGVCLPSDTKMRLDDVDFVCDVIRRMF